jgi:hypothetical protein
MYGFDPERQETIGELRKEYKEMQKLRRLAEGYYWTSTNNQCQADEVMMFLAQKAWFELRKKEQLFNERMIEEQIDKRLVGNHL